MKNAEPTILDVGRREDGTAVPTPTMAASRIPREFVGKARDLRRVLSAEDAVVWKEMSRITVPFASVGRGTVPRPAMLERAAIAWQERVPKAGRLGLTIKRTRTTLVIDELRLVSADARFAEWDEDVREPGFSVSATRLEVAPPRFRFDPVILAGVSLHAVARWFQRSFTCTHAALLSDLRVLALAATDERLAAGGAFEVPAGDGRWSGVVMSNMEDAAARFLAARTFV